MFDSMVISMRTLNLVIGLVEMFSPPATSYPPITSCHTLSPMFDTKVISAGTLNLVHGLLKILPHLATYYHMLSHLITLYPTSLMGKKCE